MAFKQLNKDVLDQVADAFSVEWTKEDPTKNEMIKDLEDEGITWEMYKEAFPDPEDEDEDETPKSAPEAEAAAKEFKKPQEKVLVRMTRANGTYQIRGYTFTKAHPYLPVSADDADYLVSQGEGFAIATPREVEEYYS